MKKILCLTLLALSIIAAPPARADATTPDTVIAEIAAIHAKLFAVDFRSLKPEDAKSYVEVLNSLENLKRSVAQLAAPVSAPAFVFNVYEKKPTWRFTSTTDTCETLLATSKTIPSRVENFAEDMIRDCFRAGFSGCEISRPARIASLLRDEAAGPYTRDCTVGLDVVIKRLR
ncbi:MAG: hypothetical protein EOP11_08785 [Proteobacteria bacterium]|nr:MAG: hypothetical protein EOP11_08785 [Pseudomonadota bacterium]